MFLNIVFRIVFSALFIVIGSFSLDVFGLNLLILLRFTAISAYDLYFHGEFRSTYFLLDNYFGLALIEKFIGLKSTDT